MRDPINVLVLAVAKAAAAPRGRGPAPATYSYFRRQLVLRYGQRTAVAMNRLEHAAPESAQAQHELGNALRMAGAQNDVELVSLAHEIVNAVEGIQSTSASAADVPQLSAIESSTRTQKWLFPVANLLMFAALALVIYMYGDLGFSDNADLYDILDLGLLPGIVALIPVWLIFRRKDNGRISWIVYSILLFTLTTVVGLGYIYHWSWTMQANFENTGQPPTLWDWLHVALLPFVVPIVTALAGAEPRSDTMDFYSFASQPPARPRSNSSPQRSRGMAILRLSPALLCAILTLVIAGAVVATPPSAHAAPEQPRPAQQNPPEMQLATISATNQWTFTTIQVSRGEHLKITAAGTISFIGGGPLVGPDGATDLHPGVCVLPGPDHHAALIGRINGINPDPPFLVGRNYDQTVDRDGMLVLGINDIGADNNSGEFAAIIQVS